MTERITGAGSLIAVPYHPLTGNPLKNTVILDAAVEFPHWFSGPSTAEERRQTAAWVLSETAITHPATYIWEVWRGAEFVGILMLGRVSPRVDALFHFVFFDRQLAGKRVLLKNFLGFAFDAFELQRISLEVPEFFETLVRFARRKLGFRFEGEDRTVGHDAVISLGVGTVTGKLDKPHLWVARQGSRRERAHYHNGEWRDILCLRLLRSEYQDLMREAGDAPSDCNSSPSRPGWPGGSADRPETAASPGSGSPGSPRLSG